MAAVLLASGAAISVIYDSEGWVNVGYRDPAPGRYETICAGHMEKGVLGKHYTDQQCADLLAADVVKHGLAIAPCLPETLPSPTRAAFISYAFNIGAAKFCRSSVAAKARAGDLKGACAEFGNPKLATAGGKPLRGLVIRRAKERALCESGLR